ncbi:MAG: cytochrome C oxidase subunit I [Pseudomonadota bacterium]
MEQTNPNNSQQKQKIRGRWKLLAVLAVCAAPMIFSYLTYYVIKPQARTNFGTLIDPRAHPMPQLGATTLDAKPASLEAYKGKWVMLKVGPAACARDCMDQMFAMQQVRSMTGKEMGRIERVWLVTDGAPLDTMLLRQLDGMRILRAPGAAVAAWLPPEPGAALEEGLWLIDPLGNLMMRFPKVRADAPESEKVQHYAKVKKDLGKLLKASAIG